MYGLTVIDAGEDGLDEHQRFGVEAGDVAGEAAPLRKGEESLAGGQPLQGFRGERDPPRDRIALLEFACFARERPNLGHKVLEEAGRQEILLHDETVAREGGSVVS